MDVDWQLGVHNWQKYVIWLVHVSEHVDHFKDRICLTASLRRCLSIVIVDLAASVFIVFAFHCLQWKAFSHNIVLLTNNYPSCDITKRKDNSFLLSICSTSNASVCRTRTSKRQIITGLWVENVRKQNSLNNPYLYSNWCTHSYYLRYK